MKPFCLITLLVLALASSCSAFFVPSPPRIATTSLTTTNTRRSGVATMAVRGPRERAAENERLRTLETDSERWFQEQERREANGELMWLENPAFYTAVFILCPVVILVAGAATGVIPGFVAQPTTYSTLEEVKNSYSYGDLTSAAQYASGATSLF